MNLNSVNKDAFTIAVIDDDDSIRWVLQKIIQDSSPAYTVVCAKSGREGLRIINSHSPDLIILDVNMPGMSGLEMLRKLKQSFSCLHTPVVMLSGEDKDEFIEESRYWYADAYLKKPVARDTLMRLIESKLATRETLKKSNKTPLIESCSDTFAG